MLNMEKEQNKSVLDELLYVCNERLGVIYIIMENIIYIIYFFKYQKVPLMHFEILPFETL